GEEAAGTVGADVPDGHPRLSRQLLDRHGVVAGAVRGHLCTLSRRAVSPINVTANDVTYFAVTGTCVIHARDQEERFHEHPCRHTQTATRSEAPRVEIGT